MKYKCKCRVYGGEGSDTCFIVCGVKYKCRVYGGEGSDTCFIVCGVKYKCRVYGGEGSDTCSGNGNVQLARKMADRGGRRWTIQHQKHIPKMVGAGAWSRKATHTSMETRTRTTQMAYNNSNTTHTPFIGNSRVSHTSSVILSSLYIHANRGKCVNRQHRVEKMHSRKALHSNQLPWNSANKARRPCNALQQHAACPYPPRQYHERTNTTVHRYVQPDCLRLIGKPTSSC